MDWTGAKAPAWLRYTVALLVIALAAGLRAWLLIDLGRGIPYLTFYPAVMVAAVFGGLAPGMLATIISAFLAYFWIDEGQLSSVEWLAMGVFLMSCTMISGISDAMRRAQASAKAAQAQAEAANKAKSVFLASMSHELRTPLNAILGFSNLMRNDKAIPEEQRKTLDLINRSGEHLLTLINDVLDMAKIEAGRVILENTVFDLGEMVLDITDLMRLRAEEKGLYLKVDQSSQFPRFACADAPKLRQTLLNLIGNAIKYTQQGGVMLRLSCQDLPAAHQLLIIEVEDTGVGISAEDQKLIFEPFVQVGRPEEHQGSGLGLAITRQNVELMGGKINLKSTLNRGSLFRVELPVEKVTPEQIPSPKTEQGEVVGLAAGQPQYRILIVEDQKENWLLLKQIVELAGFDVRVVEDGQTGIEMFHGWHPHFIWMDVRMPVMDGLEATRRIRALEGGQDVKIVALTASVFQEERQRVLSAGMDDFIRKPYRSGEIFECMGRHLGVQFVYSHAQAGSKTAKLQPLSQQMLAALPDELRSALVEALISLKREQLDETIQKITGQYPDLGAILANYAAQYQYTAILHAVQLAPKETE